MTGKGRTDRMISEAMTPADEGRIPVWVAPAVYAVVTLVLFRAFVFTDRMLYGGDTLSLGYAARAFYAGMLKEGIFPFWNPTILGGTPFLESLAGGDSLYPPSVLLLLLMDPVRALGWKLVLHVFLAGWFMELWCRRGLETSGMAAFLAGLGYLVAPFLVTLVFPGHDGKLFVTALTPLLFLAVERFLKSGGRLAFAGIAGTVALVLLTTHFQMAYFLFGAVGILAIGRTVSRGKTAMPRLGLFLLASLLGAMTAAVQLLPALDYIGEDSRRAATTTLAESPDAAKAYSASWSLHPEELVATLVVPEFAGNSAGGAEWATGTYWGRNPFKTNHEYIGWALLLLAGLGMRGGDRGRRFLLAGIGVFALLFTLGAHSPVWHAAYALLPGVSLFRAPSQAIFLTGFAVISLAAFGIDRILGVGPTAERDRTAGGGSLLRSPGSSSFLWAGALLLLALLSLRGLWIPLWDDLFGGPESQGAREALGRALPHIARGSFLAALIALAIGLLHRWGRKIGPLPVVGVLGLLILWDGTRIDAPFIQTLDPRVVTEPDANLRFLLGEASGRTEPFRILSLASQGQDVTPAQFGLELAAGHHPNDLRRYRELIGMEGSGFPTRIFDPESGRFQPNVVALLNIEWLLWPDAEFGSLQGAEPTSRVSFADGTPHSSLYPMPTLPRAFLVGRTERVAEEEMVDRILDPAFDPARVALVLPGESTPLLAGDGEGIAGSVRWLERGPNRQTLEVESEDPALLVVTDNWHDGWRGRIGEREVPVHRVNHTFRGVEIPQGRSTVTLYYSSSLLRWAGLLSAGGALILLGILLLPVIPGREREGRGSASPDGDQARSPRLPRQVG